MEHINHFKRAVLSCALGVACFLFVLEPVTAEDLGVTVFEETVEQQIQLIIQLIDDCIVRPDSVNLYEFAQLVGEQAPPQSMRRIIEILRANSGVSAAPPFRILPSGIRRMGDGYLAEAVAIYETGQGLIVDTIDFVFARDGEAASEGRNSLSFTRLGTSLDRISVLVEEAMAVEARSRGTQAASYPALDLGDSVSHSMLRQVPLHSEMSVLNTQTSQSVLGTRLFDRPFGVTAFRYYDSGLRSYDLLVMTDANWDRVIFSGRYWASNYDNPILGAYCSNGTGQYGLRAPTGVAWAAWDFFVADAYNDRVQVFDVHSGHEPPTIEYSSTLEYNFETPIDVAAGRFRAFGSLVTCVAILDQGNNRVVTWSEQDGYTPYAGFGLNNPSSICFSRNRVTHEPMQLMYVADSGNRRVVAFYMQYPQPTYVTAIQTPGGIFPTDAFLSSVDVDNYGCVYVMDATNATVYKFSPGLSDFLGKFGSQGTGDQQFLHPKRLTFGKGVKYQNGFVTPMNLDGAIVTEHFGQQTGVRRYRHGFDVLAREPSYMPAIDTYPFDFLTYRFHLTGHAKAGLKISLVDGPILFESGVELRNPGTLAFRPYFMEYNLPTDTTYEFELQLTSPYDPGFAPVLYDTLRVTRHTISIPCEEITDCQFIMSGMYITAPDACFYADPDRWYKASVPVTDRCTGEEIDFGGSNLTNFYWTSTYIPTLEFYRDTILPMLYPEHYTQGETVIDTRHPWVFFKIPTHPGGTNGYPRSPCQVFTAHAGYNSSSSGPRQTFGETALSPMFTDSCGFGFFQELAFYWDYENSPCYEAPPDPPDPGCPFLYKWNGWEYRFVNNLLPQGEGLTDLDNDAHDYYPIFLASPVDTFYYKFLITEEEQEVSKIDNFELRAFDIPYRRGELRFNDQRELVYLTDSVPPMSATTDKGEDVLDLLEKRDGRFFESGEPGWVELVYDVSAINPGASQSPEVITPPVIDLMQDPKIPAEKIAGGVTRVPPSVYQVLAPDEMGQWQSLAKVYPRVRTERRFVSLPFGAQKGKHRVRLAWTGSARLDGLSYYTTAKQEATPVKLALVEARHTGDGLVSSRLDQTDGLRQLLLPGDTIELTYYAEPPPDTLRRVFMFAATGKYRTLSEGELTGLDDPTVADFSFDQNYPNPFNPATTFNFALPSAVHVTLEVYNILGQKVATLVDQEYPAGRHSVAWDSRLASGEEIASGVYFARIKAGEFEASKKMVVVK